VIAGPQKGGLCAAEHACARSGGREARASARLRARPPSTRASTMQTGALYDTLGPVPPEHNGEGKNEMEENLYTTVHVNREDVEAVVEEVLVPIPCLCFVCYPLWTDHSNARSYTPRHAHPPPHPCRLYSIPFVNHCLLLTFFRSHGCPRIAGDCKGPAKPGQNDFSRGADARGSRG
jgi:hypothetical protein